MLGRIAFSGSKKRALYREELSCLTVQTSCIPAHKLSGRSVRKSAREFLRAGVRHVLVPPGFSYWPQLRSCGIEPVDIVPFLQATAVPLALAALAHAGVPTGRATVVLAGRWASPPLCAAALGLCPVVRRIVVSAPSGGDRLARQLQREYGLPILERCAEAHLVLLFSETGTPVEAPVLRLCAPVPDLLGLSLRPENADLPADCEALPLMAALWETGRLDIRDIAVFPMKGT